MAADSEFVTTWRVADTRDAVRAVLADGPSLPVWWPSVYLAVDPIDDGDETGNGGSAAMFTKGWLPYTLRWTLLVTEPITEDGYALTATGDLVGTGRWTFETNGPEVVITYDWPVSASKPLLRKLLLRPIFAANHRWAMARGEESLRLELRRRRAKGVDERRVVPAPPPPTLRRLVRGGRG